MKEIMESAGWGLEGSLKPHSRLRLSTEAEVAQNHSEPLPSPSSLSRTRRRSVTFANEPIRAGSDQPLALHTTALHQAVSLSRDSPGPSLPARRLPARSKSSINLATLQVDDPHDPASMRTTSDPNLGAGHRRRLSEDSGRFRAKASNPAAAFPFRFADSSYLPKPFADSPRSSSKAKQGSRLSTVLSWKMNKRTSMSSQVVGGPEQEPGALGYGRSGTWDQMSPYSEPPSSTLSRRSSYAASSIDEAHSPQPPVHSHSCVLEDQHHSTQPTEFKGPSTRSQPLLTIPRTYGARYGAVYAGETPGVYGGSRSVSTSRRPSSGPVCAGEAQSMGSVAQHGQRGGPQSVGSARSASVSRRPSSGPVYAGDAHIMGSMAQHGQHVPRSAGSACSIYASRRPSSGPVYTGEAPSVGGVTQGQRSRRSSAYKAESASAASSRTTAHAECLPTQLPVQPAVLPSQEPLQPSPLPTQAPLQHSGVSSNPEGQAEPRDRPRNGLAATYDCFQAPGVSGNQSCGASGMQSPEAIRTAGSSSRALQKSKSENGAAGSAAAGSAAVATHVPQQAAPQQNAPAVLEGHAQQASRSKNSAAGSAAAGRAAVASHTAQQTAPPQKPLAVLEGHAQQASRSKDCSALSGSQDGRAGSAAGTSHTAQQTTPQPEPTVLERQTPSSEQKPPAVLEGRPKGWKALSFAKSKLFRSFMP